MTQQISSYHAVKLMVSAVVLLLLGFGICHVAEAQVSVSASGTPGSNGFQMTLGSHVSAGTSGFVTAWADSTTNRFMVNNNNVGDLILATWPCTTTGCIAYGGMVTSTVATENHLDGNTTTTTKYLQSVGTGSAATAPSWQQVSFSDLSGSVAAAQMPALTGDCTTAAGSVATTCGGLIDDYQKATATDASVSNNGNDVAVYSTSVSPPGAGHGISH